MHMSESSPSAAFAQFRDQQNTAATRRATGGSNVASEASYWCNQRETSEIQAKAYAGQRGTRTRMRIIYIHSLSILYTTVCMEGPWHLLFNVRQRMVYMEFRRGFCTLVLSFILVSPIFGCIVLQSHGASPQKNSARYIGSKHAI